MARRERFSRLKDFLERHRNMIVYILSVLGLLGCIVGWGMLPDMVSINPDAENTVIRSKEVLVGLHFGMISIFTVLFWRRAREVAYLVCAMFGVIMLYGMLYANLGV